MSQRVSQIDKLGIAWKNWDNWLLSHSWAPSAEGTVWFALSFVIMVQGLVRGFNLVTFVATFLLSMWLLNMLVTVFSKRRLKQLRARRRFVGTAHVGTPVVSHLEMENHGLSRVSGLHLLDEGSGHQNVIGLSHLDPHQTLELTRQIVPLRRGWYEWKPLRVATGYPFGLCRRSIICPTVERETLVLPLLGQLDHQQFQKWLRASRRAAALQTRARSRRTAAPADFYGIRSYRPGDSARWIHWRTTARVGSPMVREFEEPPEQHLTIILEAWLPDAEATLRKTWNDLVAESPVLQAHLHSAKELPSEQSREEKLRACVEPLNHIEQAVSLACTLCHTWTRKLGSTVTLGVVDGDSSLPALMESGPTLKQLMPVMERLAQVRPVPATDGTRLIQVLQNQAQDPGTIILIAPYASPLAQTLQQSLGRTVQLLDVSSKMSLQRFFTSQACAVR